MLGLKSCALRSSRLRTATTSLGYSRQASRVAVKIPFTSPPLTPPPFPVIETCPSPTCQCREMPPGLEIDRERPVNGMMASYAEQVLISTGRCDWKSNIEDESDAIFYRQMKKFIGRGGKYSDPYHNVLFNNTSFQPSRQQQQQQQQQQQPSSVDKVDVDGDSKRSPQSTASVFLFPSFKYIPNIPTSDSSISDFIKAFLLPKKLHPAHDNAALSSEQKNVLLCDPSMRSRFPGVRDVDEICVLICGHGGRDSRCGIMGPILQAEFEEKLARQNISLLKDDSASSDDKGRDAPSKGEEGYLPSARVGSVSHIGGHKFAGNVIIYIPPSFTSNALAGKGIWYARVEPAHVEGIVAKTILEGKVIKDHFRGGIGKDGEVLRL